MIIPAAIQSQLNSYRRRHAEIQERAAGEAEGDQAAASFEMDELRRRQAILRTLALRHGRRFPRSAVMGRVAGELRATLRELEAIPLVEREARAAEIADYRALASLAIWPPEGA